MTLLYCMCSKGRYMHTIFRLSQYCHMLSVFNNYSLSLNGFWVWMSYWLRGHEDERNNCFSKIQLVGQKYQDKTTLASKMRFSCHCFGFQSQCFSLLVGYNIYPSSISTNQNTALTIDHWLDFTKVIYTCWLFMALPFSYLYFYSLTLVTWVRTGFNRRGSEREFDWSPSPCSTPLAPHISSSRK